MTSTGWVVVCTEMWRHAMFMFLWTVLFLLVWMLSMVVLFALY